MDNDDAAESEEEHQWGGSQMISLLTQTLPQGTFDSISCFMNVTFLILELSRIFFLTSHRAYLMSMYVSNFFFKFSFQVVTCNYQVFRLMHKIHCYKDMQHSLYLYSSVNYASLTEKCVYYGKFINRKWRI